MRRQHPKNAVHPGVRTPGLRDGQSDRLTARQERFVEEYLVDLNATRAAIRAGYSPKGAEVRGCELLRNRKVAAMIGSAKADRAARTRIAADRVLEEVGLIAFSDIRDLDFDAAGRLTGATPEATRTVAAYAYARRTGRGGHTVQYTVRLWDKLGALRLLMRHLGLLDRPLTLETILALLPPDVSSLLTRILVEAEAERAATVRQTA